jgi:hypothetical protein
MYQSFLHYCYETAEAIIKRDDLFWFTILKVPVQDQVDWSPLPWASGNGGPSWQECVAEQTAYISSQEAERDYKTGTTIPFKAMSPVTFH